MDKTVGWLWLQQTFGGEIWEHIGKDGDPAEVFDREHDNGKGLSPDEVRAMICRAEEMGQRVVCIDDEDYPESLRTLDDAPAVLFCMGDVSLMNSMTAVHMVGTRQPTRYTASLISVLCRELVLRGFAVSCGLAEGADALTAEAVLDNGGKLISVVPAALNGSYPKDRSLAERVAKSGLLVSVRPPDSKARPDFRRRNRLAVALSGAVIFTQAAADSKGLDNAKQAEKLGRPVLAVPPHLLYAKEYFGQRDLLRNGCMPLFDGGDAVRVMAENGVIADGSHALGNVKSHSAADGAAGKSAAKRSPAKKTPAIDADSSEGRIFAELNEHGELHVDELAAKCGMGMAEVMAALTSLEIDGMVKSLPGRRYVVS